jgi:ABC-2 type transport system ATP-binding protein
MDRVNVVTVEELTKDYDGRRVVDEITFTVPRGTVTGLLGPNGAGKTTTLRMLLGLVKPTSGRAALFGRPYRELVDPVRRVGSVLDTKAFHPKRRGRDHLRVVATAAGVPVSRVDEMIALVGLGRHAGRRVGDYSLGTKQRLALATALLGDPELLVLDEPSNGLDPEGIRWLRHFLQDRAAGGCTVLMSSHLLAEMAQTVDHVVILDRGRVMADSPLPALLEGAGVLVRSPQAERLRGLLAAEGREIRVTGADELEVVGMPPERVAEIAASGAVPLHLIRPMQRTLEDAFVALTGSEVAR